MILEHIVHRLYFKIPTNAYLNIVIGILSVTQCSFSLNLNCTKLTTSCPTAAQWLDRAKMFNCAGKKKYICLLAPGNTLREGCIFNSAIEAGQIGCPYTTQCDIRTGQPVLVTANNFLPCPPDHDGCPQRNHPGYSILEIYKYARCQGRNSSDERSVSHSPDEFAGTQPNNNPSENPRYVNWTLIITSILIGFIVIFFLIVFIVRRKKCKRSMSNDSEILRNISSSDCSPDDNGTVPLLCPQPYDNGQYHATSQTYEKQYKMPSIPCQYTQLHKAESNDHMGTEDLDAKTDFNGKGGDPDTSLHMASLKGDINTVKILIDSGTDVSARDCMQDLPLHRATLNGHSDTVRMLSDMNAKNWEKDTLLHEAARYDHDEIIRILLSSAADFTIRNINGKTAEELGNPKSKQVFSDCLEKVPREIKRLGVDAVRQFLKSLNEDAVAINVVSCMFVGHVGVGKTTLVNRILGMPRKKTKITNDIDLHMRKIFANTNTGEWHIEDEQTEKIIGLNDFTQINVWDFAGKMMYYTMHQGHLSPRRLYCLVFNASLGLDSMVDDHSVDLCDKDKISVKDYIEFWVTTITTYVQSDVRGFPRIALVGTHIDKLQDTWKISQIIEEIKSKFQPLVDTGQLILHEDLFINACDMNAETKRKLRDIILSCGKSYPEYGQMIPRSWNDLHQTFILRKSEKVISFDQFEQINSQMKKPLNEKELILCIEYFHSLGYFLFFPDEDLKDHIVLDPTWITNAILSFITCSNSTSENWRVKKWLQMQITGKIEHAYFEEVLLENNVEARYSHHLHKVMKRLDLASEPKVYNAEGFEERQNYFYMPCIINRYISPDALSLTGNQDAVHLSFSFSTVIPPAVYNKLVASSLSLWPIFESHIYNGLIILRSGPFHLIAFRKEQMQINISVVHLQDQRQINASLCRTIVQFVEQRLTWILSIYNTSTVERKSLFHITYNSTAAERLNARKTEEEESENCEDCEDRWESDVTQDNYVPDDLFLMRVASQLTDKDIYPLAEKVYNHKRFADDLESDYTELKTSDIAWLILIEWRRQEQDQERTPDLMGLRLVLHQAKINPHVLCRVFSQKDEHPFLLDPDYLRTDVHSELLHAVADRISSEYIHVGLQLGLKADGILKLMKNFKGRTVGLIRAMLQEWYDKNNKKGHVKVVQLATALLNAKSDISVFYEFGKQRFHVRYGQNATEKLGLEILYRRT